MSKRTRDEETADGSKKVSEGKREVEPRKSEGQANGGVVEVGGEEWEKSESGNGFVEVLVGFRRAFDHR